MVIYPSGRDVQSADATVPPDEKFANVITGAGSDGGGGIFDDEVSVTDPPAQIELIDALAVTVGAEYTETAVVLMAEQLFASLIVTV